jgi:transcriptional regulator with XRE-family HTH domain
MAKNRNEDSAMAYARDRFEKSGLSLHELGIKMGYPEESARKSVWQFLKTSDPRISMLRRFAEAIGLPIEELVAEKKGRSG